MANQKSACVEVKHPVNTGTESRHEKFSSRQTAASTVCLQANTSGTGLPVSLQ